MLKKIIILNILALGLLGTINCSAQRHGAYAASGLEYTVAGGFWSVQAGVELNRHRLGAIYEWRMNNKTDRLIEAYSFKALQYEFTFLREKNLSLGLMLRGGLSNDEFVVIVPAITTNFIFNDCLKMNLVTGFRGEKPSLGLNLFFNIPFKKNEYPHSILKF